MIGPRYRTESRSRTSDKPHVDVIPAGVRSSSKTPCEYGRSGHCMSGTHHECSNSKGGPLQDGMWMPSGYLCDSKGNTTQPPIPFGPWHLWRCPCECHPEQVYAPTSKWLKLTHDEGEPDD